MVLYLYFKLSKAELCNLVNDFTGYFTYFLLSVTYIVDSYFKVTCNLHFQLTINRIIFIPKMVLQFLNVDTIPITFLRDNRNITVSPHYYKFIIFCLLIDIRYLTVSRTSCYFVDCIQHLDLQTSGTFYRLLRLFRSSRQHQHPDGNFIQRNDISDTINC